MRDGHADGARQLATTLRIYSSTVNNDQLRAALRKANRQQILLTQPNHRELMREAEELDINPSTLPPHTFDASPERPPSNSSGKEGLSPLMNRVADFVDSVGAKMESLERSVTGEAVAGCTPSADPRPRRLRQLQPGKTAGGHHREHRTRRLRGVSRVPVLGLEACAAVTRRYLTFYMAYAACQAIVQLCKALQFTKEGAMNPTVLAIALMIVGWVGGRLLIRRFPTVSYTQMFCASAAWLSALARGRTERQRVLVTTRDCSSPSSWERS